MYSISHLGENFVACPFTGTTVDHSDRACWTWSLLLALIRHLHWTLRCSTGKAKTKAYLYTKRSVQDDPRPTRLPVLITRRRSNTGQYRATLMRRAFHVGYHWTWPCFAVLDPWPATPSDDTGHATHDTTSNTPHTTHDTIHCVSGQDLLTIAVLVMCAAHVTGHSPCPFSAVHLLIHGNLKLDHW